jgi:hypothetical protein
MPFSNEEVLWATQIALARFQHAKSNINTESDFRIFGVSTNSKFSISNIDGEKWIYAASLTPTGAIVRRIPMFFSTENPDYNASLWRTMHTVTGSVTDICVEFDGWWEQDYSVRKNRLVTDSTPWIFYVESGVLYGRYGDELPVELSEDAVKISSVRGWVPLDGDHTNDQGIIVGYTKTDGSVCYRAYCKQIDGSKIWETEQAISFFGTSCDSISLFRANDFRVGFAATRSGELYWTLTHRNYAGMSVWTDKVTTAISELSIAVTPLSYWDSYVPDEYITASVGLAFLGAAEPVYPELVSLSNAQNDYRILVKLSHPVEQDVTSNTIRDRFSVSDSLSTTFAITSTSAGADASEIYLNMVNFSAAKNPMTVVFDSGASEGVPSYLTVANGGLSFDVPSFSASFTALIEPPKLYATENITAAISSMTFIASLLTYHSRYRSEQITAAVSSVNVVVTKVGSNPL